MTKLHPTFEILAVVLAVPVSTLKEDLWLRCFLAVILAILVSRKVGTCMSHIMNIV